MMAAVKKLGASILQFLNTQQTLKEIKRLMRKSKVAELAIAFWGKGALEELDLAKRIGSTRVICNLALGGTNPAVIEALAAMGPSVSVQQSDRLHAKVYLFEDAAIIGSSNASANGLGFEGTATAYWHEASMLVDDQTVLHDIRKWMTSFQTHEITSSDLRLAQEQWNDRRRMTPVVGRTVLEALREAPDQFKDRSVYFVVAVGSLSDKGEAFRNDLQQNHYKTDRVDVFENWPELPKDGILLCFGVRDKTVVYDGVWERLPQYPDHDLGKKTTGQVVWKVDNTRFPIRGDVRTWKRICRQTIEERQINESKYFHIADIAKHI
jgi:hypothetical protein